MNIRVEYIEHFHNMDPRRRGCHWATAIHGAGDWLLSPKPSRTPDFFPGKLHDCEHQCSRNNWQICIDAWFTIYCECCERDERMEGSKREMKD